MGTGRNRDLPCGSQAMGTVVDVLQFAVVRKFVARFARHASCFKAGSRSPTAFLPCMLTLDCPMTELDENTNTSQLNRSRGLGFAASTKTR